MGCDIHLFTERKRAINSQEKWTNVDNWKINPYYDGEDKQEKEYELNSAYRYRNYNLFSILADVRNYRENKPISEPKGLPNDVSEIVKIENDIWESDGHSHSYFTMKELYDYHEENKSDEDTDLKNLIEVLEGHFKDSYYEKERDCEKYRIVFWFDN